jgi:hypothetical protein
VAKFGFRDAADDILQDIIVQMIQWDVYGRFDPERAPLRGYLSRIVHNFFCHEWHRRRRDLARSLELVDDSAAAAAPPERGLALELDEERLETLEALARIIDGEHPYTSGVAYRGSEYLGEVFLGEVPPPGVYHLWRSSSNLFRILALGYQAVDASRAMMISKGFCSKKLRRLAQMPAIRDWAAELGFDFAAGHQGDSDE